MRLLDEERARLAAGLPLVVDMIIKYRRAEAESMRQKETSNIVHRRRRAWTAADGGGSQKKMNGLTQLVFLLSSD